MSNTVVAAVYRYVIDDVVRNVQGDFEGHGVDTSVLEDLQRSWETKVIESRVAAFPSDSGLPDTHDDYLRPAQIPAAQPINAAASLASIINNPESMAPTAASLASLAQSGRQLEDDEDEDTPITSRPHQYKQAHHAYQPAGHHVPQNDGAEDNLEQLSPMQMWEKMKNERKRVYDKAKELGVPQMDGASDDDEPTGPVENPEDAINSDLDDTDEEDEVEGGGEETEHIVLCQYDKVTRSKNKWKCVLKDGIMLINGRDYLFLKATGDFEW
ncbi:transcription factor IIA subunit alpha [Linderina macrospora]|uniref:Transcription factor IIA subunit alpha n=1 Tax=Linderina macrospora TaxID=4868 RepID=A0ACC1J3C9_9FUNG|nr:transcription factor IIA subunit alpha [Linderina macrospora]